MTVASSPLRKPTHQVVGRRKGRYRRYALHAFLMAICTLWLFPVLWAAYASLRSYADTAERGYVSLPRNLNFDNYTNAWNQAELPKYYLNTFIIVVPSVVLIILLGTMVAFAASRLSLRFNVAMVMLFTAGNLLPPQVIITPLFRLFLALPLPAPLSDNGVFYDQFVGIIAIQVAVHIGFCVFVLSNYLKTISGELIEAARVDGASIWRIFWSIIMPLCRPAHAALATLLVTWIYNDFFWALLLMRTGDKLPITTALSNLSGEFFTNHNLLAAGSLLVAVPTILVYLLLQRHFVSGLTLGSSKG